MNASQRGIDLIKFSEGFRAKPYKDSGGIMSIGWGHAIKPNESFSEITAEEGERLLREDLYSADRCINVSLGTRIKEQNEFDALISFIFNIGCGAFQSSNVFKYLKIGEYGSAFMYWSKWIHDSKMKAREGLVTRRRAEITLFNEKNKYVTDKSIADLFIKDKVTSIAV